MLKEIKLIKKLHLCKGYKYIIFLSGSGVNISDLANLNKMLVKKGFNCLIIQTLDDTKIKVVEQEKK